MHATAIDQDCNLLLACDISQRTYPHRFTNAWPSSEEHFHFLPVGPWNTDGLIIVADGLSAEQTNYLAELVAARHPIVFAGFPGSSPSVVVDNAGGIRQAVDHLRFHGHTRIAFIAGYEHQPGDSRVRFQAYLEALHDNGQAFDPRLVAYGQSGANSGRRAMQQILARGVPFTAVLAHNDSSGMGAIEALREAGLRIPEDVAVIGFDDVLEARALTPPLTTIHHPTFTLGGQAVRTMIDIIAGQSPDPPIVQIPTRLVIRRSCGCRPGVDAEIGDIKAPKLPTSESKAELARTMANATLLEVQASAFEVEVACQNLIKSFTTSLCSRDGTPFIDALIGVLRDAEARGEDAYAWQSTLSTLRRGLSELLPATPDLSAYSFVDELLDQARQVVGERVRRQTTHAFIRSMDAAEVLGLMTAELLAALDEAQISTILAEYLPRIGVRHMLVARFEPEDDDLVAQSTLLLSYGLAQGAAGQRFMTRQFPPPGIYRSDTSFQLALLPLAGQKEVQGFVAFDAANLEPCAVIARNLAAALRSGHLYAAANEARHRAEEANRLKSRFLSMISHDLRTLLNLIIGLSEMVLREQQQIAAQPDTMAQDIKQISMNAQHLGQLIGDVLDLASSEAGQLRLLREPLNLAEVLRVVALTGEQMAREKGLTWQVHMPPAGPWVLGDRTRLRQIVLNLISNAVKFTARGSVTLEVTVEDDQVMVAISDTGLGVPTAEQSCIFDEFQRGERTFAHGYDGLGLGLAICKQLVELHGGAIGVRSSGEEGSGATFFFTLPTMPEILAAPELQAAAPVGEQTIAFLTESTKVGSPLESYLAEHGWHTQLCRVDVEPDWLQRLLAAPPGMILLDAQLALAQGWQILAALERHPTTEQIPLVICSLDPHTQQGALLELNYQRKPLDATHLARILNEQGLRVNEKDDTKRCWSWTMIPAS
jgi:signal transduction histidine kinase